MSASPNKTAFNTGHGNKSIAKSFDKIFIAIYFDNKSLVIRLAMETYHPLPDIIERLSRHLSDGENAVLTGHRRIGKTLLMQHLEDNAPDSFVPTYLIVESVDTVNEFYRKLVAHLSDNFISRWDKAGRGVSAWFRKVNIQEVGKTIRFGDPKQIDYHAEFRNLIESMEPERPIVLMLDEFPQVIENIRDDKDGGEAEVKRLLTTQREFRQEPRFKDKIRFVYAGSIGLQNVVEGLGFSKHINDLREVKMRPFRRDEAEAYLDGLLQRRSLTAAPDIAALILERIDWLAPFFISLLVDELFLSPIEAAHIDAAFTASLKHRNNFEHWHRRLRPPALKQEEYRFCKTLLNSTADPAKSGSDQGEIYNLAVAHGVEDEVPRLLNILQHDGYLVRDERNRYRFVSPVIRAWWWSEIAN